jgi:hypothetical protein
LRRSNFVTIVGRESAVPEYTSSYDRAPLIGRQVIVIAVGELAAISMAAVECMATSASGEQLCGDAIMRPETASANVTPGL